MTLRVPDCFKWDLYWIDSDIPREVLNKANQELTTAAQEALDTFTPSIWEDVSDKYWLLGAADTEPRVQFNGLWRKQYGNGCFSYYD